MGAIFVPSTGIVSYSRICEVLAALIRDRGGEVRFHAEVHSIREQPDRVLVECGQGCYAGGLLVACAGLMSDRIVRMLGLTPSFRIIPFRGEYFQLPLRHNRIVNHLIYPIPDPDLPFLGVHLTRMIDGTVTVGPNAVLAFHAKEACRRRELEFVESYNFV